MADLKALQRGLLDAVLERLKADGYQKSAQTFRAPFAHGSLCFHLAFIEHRAAGSFDVTGDVAVRYDAVEDLVNETNAQLSKKEKLTTASLGAEFGNIIGSGQKRWTVRDSSDIDPVADQLRATFEEVGRPMLQRFSDPLEALRVLASDGDPEARLYSPVSVARALRAVGLASAFSDEGRLREVVAAKNRALAGEPEPMLRQYRELLAGLGLH